jgi:NADH-quinone oxidoreductase subunit F
MLSLANNLGIMPGTTICGLADGAAWPIKNAVTKFRGELEEFIRTHRSAGHEVTRLQQSIADGKRAVDSPSPLPVLTASGSSLRQTAGNGPV